MAAVNIRSFVVAAVKIRSFVVEAECSLREVGAWGQRRIPLKPRKNVKLNALKTKIIVHYICRSYLAENSVLPF